MVTTPARIYNIPLRKAGLKTQRHKRANKAVSTVRDFVIKNSKSSDVKIGKHLNLKLWANGIKNVPNRIKVDAIKDDKGTVTVELFGAPKEAKVEAKKKAAETPAEKIAEKIQAMKPGKKANEKTTEAVITKETPKEAPKETKPVAKKEIKTAADSKKQ
jgi:ribosomal protein L31E